jgi:EAL domain-containing protein (putative c-di-GMP-specific phosphodiesterase class I)
MGMWDRLFCNMDDSAERVSADALLDSAIAFEQIEVHYQPLIEPRSGRVAGAEALARSAIEPNADALFARATRAGLAERLSRLIQRKALCAAAAWQGPLKGLSVSLNLLPGEIARDDFHDSFSESMHLAGIDPARVIVEITENALLVADTGVSERLSRLRDEGVRIAIDDFGTGYASLAYLTSLPLDLIKIDRGLITEIAGRNRDRIVVKAMIRLARELDLKVVVEGVEDEAQLALLADWGCDLYQGFLGAAALSEDELLRFVGTGQVMLIDSLLSGRRRAAPFRRSIYPSRPATSGKPLATKVTTAPFGPRSSLAIRPWRQFSLTSTILSRFAVSSGSAPKRSIISAAKASIAGRSSSSPSRR